MLHRSDLHKAARDIFCSALRAVDARQAVLTAMYLEGPLLRIREVVFDTSSRPIYVVAIGKAAPAMAIAVNEILGFKLVAGVISGPPLAAGQGFDSRRWRVFAGGHPLPNQQSLDAAGAVFDLLQRAKSDEGFVIFLISGGGSGMIEWPPNQTITLADLREANRQLVSCGASIAEINAVRRAFSALKGGRLAAYMPLADQITLIISDTNRGDEANVASGPTLSSPPDSPNPGKILNLYGLATSLPSPVLTAIKKVQSDGPLSARSDGRHVVLLDNQTALDAAAEKACQLGFSVEVASDIREQPIAEGSKLLLSRLHALWERSFRSQKPACLLSGGEFSCPLKGEGIGGRNLETVLRCIVELDKRAQDVERGPQHLIALSAGTDGLDGNSPAAGALADETTLARARSLALDAQSCLTRSDSFSFFNAVGDALVTGPTGTNVRDLRILLASGQNSACE